MVRLKDNQLKNIFVIYHDAIRRIENFLEAHDDEFFKNFMVKNKLKSAVFHAFTAGLSQLQRKRKEIWKFEKLDFMSI